MFYSLLVLRRAAAAFLVIACLLATDGLAGFSHAESLPLASDRIQVETITLTPDEKVLAHHEGSSAGVGQLLHDDQQDSEAEVSDSLWGNMLLSMAYRRDAELKRVVKKMGLSNNLFLASIAGVSGLGLAQSITGLATLNQHDTGGGHHENEEGGHGGGHKESLAPSVMGLVGSGATLLSIGAHVFFEHRYKKQIKARQQVINHQVLHILEDLEGGINHELVQPKLVTLVGERASGEFLQLWRAAHP